MSKPDRPDRSNRKNRGPDWEKPGTGPGTGPVELEKLGRARNRDKTGHPLVEPVTQSTRCRVTRLLLFFFPSFDHAAPFLKKLHSFLTFYFTAFFNIINQNNPVPMLTETFNIVGAQGNFLKFVYYFILLYVFIYFKLNELFLKKIYDNDLGVDIF